MLRRPASNVQRKFLPLNVLVRLGRRASALGRLRGDVSRLWISKNVLHRPRGAAALGKESTGGREAGQCEMWAWLPGGTGVRIPPLHPQLCD